MSSPLNIIRDKSLTSDDNTIHLLEGDDVKRAKVELWIGKALGTELHKHYPSRAWTVDVDIERGSLTVKLPEVSLANGYVLALTRTMDDLVNQMKRVGGEILERGGVSRATRHDSDDIEALDRDFKDTVLGQDVEAPEEEYKRKSDEAVKARAVAAQALRELKKGVPSGK